MVNNIIWKICRWSGLRYTYLHFKMPHELSQLVLQRDAKEYENI